MMDRPIIFSGPMIRALLAGRKTQTRRIVNVGRYPVLSVGYHSTGVLKDYDKGRHGLEFISDEHGLWHPETNPSGRSGWYVPVQIRTGDRLWVREKIHIRPIMSAEIALDYADEEDTNIIGGWKKIRPVALRWPGKRPDKPKWVPSIHMPRWASRLTLTVTSVKVERLQHISDADARAEGVEVRDGCWGTWNADDTLRCGGSMDPREAFRCLWININGNGSWDANPWVAAYSFSVEQKNIDA